MLKDGRWKNMIASRTNPIVMKPYCQLQDKLYRNEKLFLATGQLASQCMKTVAVWTNLIVTHRHVLMASMRRCVKCCCLDKSDRIAKS